MGKAECLDRVDWTRLGRRDRERSSSRNRLAEFFMSVFLRRNMATDRRSAPQSDPHPSSMSEHSSRNITKHHNIAAGQLITSYLTANHKNRMLSLLWIGGRCGAGSGSDTEAKRASFCGK